MNNTTLVSVRGAISAQNDKNSIAAAAVKLLDRIYFKNGIGDGDIISIIISSTKDITACYPAEAIRKAGHDVRLFSCLEPDIDGAPDGMIRMLVLTYSRNPVFDVYMNGARSLRPDLTGVYSIALDGPSGAGKSTVAKRVAEKLGVTYLDTGALYRALGLKCLRENVPASDAQKVEDCLKNADVDIKYSDGVQHVYLDGEDVSGKIRTPEVSMAASASSAIPFVRAKLLGLQRSIAAQSSVILDGRDIGTVVLPHAEFKFFLTASAEVRAKRRYDELVSKGQNVVYADVYNDVITRDRNDSTRAVAPLKCAYDAVEINSDRMTAEEVTDLIIKTIAEVTER